MPRFSWTVHLGRWAGVPVQVHLLFLIFVLFIFGLEWHFVSAHPSVYGIGLAALGAVFFSVLLHEIAHAFTAICLGGQVKDLVLVPWGGASRIEVSENPKIRMMVVAAGPIVNLALFVVGALILVGAGQETLGDLMNPTMRFRKSGVGMEMLVTKMVTWVNFQLFVVNLLPVYPFDGSRFLRAAIKARQPLVSNLSLETILIAVGIGTGVLFFAAAFFLRDYNVGLVQPVWLVLVGAGIILIFSARYSFHVQMEQREFARIEDEVVEWTEQPLFEDDASADTLVYEQQPPHFLSHPDKDVISQWLEEHKSGSEQAERSVEQGEEKRVDTILEKLHHQGIDALTEDERSFLDRISKQYRRRREARS